MPSFGICGGREIQRTPGLILERVMELFDHWIGQDFAGHPLHFRARRFAIQAAVERKLKVLALADIGNPLVPHLGQRALNGFALWIQDALLHRDVNVGFHELLNYTIRPERPRPERPGVSDRRAIGWPVPVAKPLPRTRLRSSTLRRKPVSSPAVPHSPNRSRS